MKSKKVTMLAAALVVAVVALAGVGFATSYTAKTTSTNDVAASAYIKVSQSETGAYDGNWLAEKVYFDTENKTNASTFEYTLHKDWKVDGTSVVEGSDMALISGALKLTITGQNSSDNSLKLTVSTSDLSIVTGLTYRIILATTYDVQTVEGVTTTTISGIVGNADYSNGSWEFSSITASNGNATFYALMFLEADSAFSADPGARAGFAASASFEFLVEADA